MTVGDLVDKAGMPPVVTAIVKGLMPAAILEKPVCVRVDETARKITLDIGETRCLELGFDEVAKIG